MPERKTYKSVWCLVDDSGNVLADLGEIDTADFGYVSHDGQSLVDYYEGLTPEQKKAFRAAIDSSLLMQEQFEFEQMERVIASKLEFSGTVELDNKVARKLFGRRIVPTRLDYRQ